jgi:hypothetical protein
MKAFEIHTFQSGRWKIDSIFDDKELALFEAKRMDGSGRFSGVRVVEEAFDESTNKTSARTIYRGTKATQSNKEDLQAKLAARQEAALLRRRKVVREAERRRAEQRKAKKKKQSNPYRLISILLLLAVIALGALYALERLRDIL